MSMCPLGCRRTQAPAQRVHSARSIASVECVGQKLMAYHLNDRCLMFMVTFYFDYVAENG